MTAKEMHRGRSIKSPSNRGVHHLGTTEISKRLPLPTSFCKRLCFCPFGQSRRRRGSCVGLPLKRRPSYSPIRRAELVFGIAYTEVLDRRLSPTRARGHSRCRPAGESINCNGLAHN